VHLVSMATRRTTISRPSVVHEEGNNDQAFIST
jgi:hypothetical protein